MNYTTEVWGRRLYNKTAHLTPCGYPDRKQEDKPATLQVSGWIRYDSWYGKAMLDVDQVLHDQKVPPVNL